jgi:hypothetical protein
VLQSAKAQNAFISGMRCRRFTISRRVVSRNMRCSQWDVVERKKVLESKKGKTASAAARQIISSFLAFSTTFSPLLLPRFTRFLSLSLSLSVSLSLSLFLSLSLSLFETLCRHSSNPFGAAGLVKLPPPPTQNKCHIVTTPSACVRVCGSIGYSLHLPIERRRKQAGSSHTCRNYLQFSPVRTIFAFGLSAKLMPKALELLFAPPPTPFVDFFF